MLVGNLLTCYQMASWDGVAPDVRLTLNLLGDRSAR